MGCDLTLRGKVKHKVGGVHAAGRGLPIALGDPWPNAQVTLYVSCRKVFPSPGESDLHSKTRSQSTCLVDD